MSFFFLRSAGGPEEIRACRGRFGVVRPRQPGASHPLSETSNTGRDTSVRMCIGPVRATPTGVYDRLHTDNLIY